MVKYLLIFIFVLCFLFQACSVPVAVGYNENVVVDIGEDNWFDSEIEIPDNSLVEFVVIGSLENHKKKRNFSAPDASEYSFSAKQKNDELLSKHKILKARIINKDSTIIKTFVINSSQNIFCSEGGTLWFETVSPDDFKHIVNVHVKEVEGLSKKKKHKNLKDKISEIWTSGGRKTEDGGRKTEDGRRRTEDGGRKTADGGRKTADGRRRTEDGGRKMETRIFSKKDLNLEVSKKSESKSNKKTNDKPTQDFTKELEKEIATEEKKGTDKVLIKEPKSELKKNVIASKDDKKSLAPDNYVKIREKEEIPLSFNEVFINDESKIEKVKLSKAEEERLLSDILGISDPIEPFNRFMFKIEDVLFVYIISPLGKTYAFVVPHFFRMGIKRMDYNIQMPKRLFNNLLQAKFVGAGMTFSTFLVNTTIGLGGFFDPASAWFGWKKYDEDFGQTLGKWGVGPGFYIYIPLIGSETARDGASEIVDMGMDPRNALTITPAYGVTVFMKFNNISLEIDDIEQKKEEYFDAYSLKRKFWYMKRTADIAD